MFPQLRMTLAWVTGAHESTSTRGGPTADIEPNLLICTRKCSAGTAREFDKGPLNVLVREGRAKNRWVSSKRDVWRQRNRRSAAWVAGAGPDGCRRTTPSPRSVTPVDADAVAGLGGAGRVEVGAVNRRDVVAEVRDLSADGVGSKNAASLRRTPRRGTREGLRLVLGGVGTGT